MLQLFKRMKYRTRDMIMDVGDRIRDTWKQATGRWEQRFKWGFSFTGLVTFLNRFDNGACKISITVCQLLSSGTGHWPIALLDVAYIGGPRRSWHVHILGVTYGTMWMSHVSEPKEDGSCEILGPDYRKHYVFFSCINHKNKSLEEVVHNAR